MKNVAFGRAIASINSLAQRLESQPQNLSLQRQLLETLSDQPTIHRPDLVSDFGYKCVVLHGHALGDEQRWEMTERVLIASLEVGSQMIAEKCLSMLTQKFPGSGRVNRLRGMLYESHSNWAKAIETYDSILRHNPVDILTLKRQVCCHRARGNWNEAIGCINNLLSISAGDVQSWRELAELYIHQKMFNMAKFALEEVLLLEPANYAAYLQYAELLYTIGDKRSMETARKYYAMTIELNPDNVRALFGLLLCVRGSKYSRVRGAVGDKLQVFASKRVLELYNAEQNSLCKLIHDVVADH